MPTKKFELSVLNVPKGVTQVQLQKLLELVIEHGFRSLDDRSVETSVSVGDIAVAPLVEPELRSAEGPHSWLDKHIAAQAAHYGISPEQKAQLFDGAAEFGEQLEQGLVDEPEAH